MPDTPLAPPVTVPLEATFRVVVTPLSTTVTVALPLAARFAAFRATVATATPAAASAETSPPDSTPSWLVSLVIVTVGAAGALMCSVTLALFDADVLPYWSVCVALTVAVCASPGLAKFRVIVPLL